MTEVPTRLIFYIVIVILLITEHLFSWWIRNMNFSEGKDDVAFMFIYLVRTLLFIVAIEWLIF